MRRLLLLLALLLPACDNTTAAPDAAALDAATPDGAAGCPPCSNGAICVERYDGTCGTAGPVCVTTSLVCPSDSCSTECEQALCGDPYQCQDRVACGGEAAGAFTCYGP